MMPPGPSRRTFLSLAATVSTSLLARVSAVDALATAGLRISRSGQIDLLKGLGRTPDRNVLKLFRAVVDVTRNRMYVTGVRT